MDDGQTKVPLERHQKFRVRLNRFLEKPNGHLTQLVTKPI